MKVIFRVPPSHQSTSSDSSFVVSLPFEDIARAKNIISNDCPQVTCTSTTSNKKSKKHKRKRHHHAPHASILEQFPSTSKQESDNSKSVTVSTVKPLLNQGKDLKFHYLPGKEAAYRQIHMGSDNESDIDGVDCELAKPCRNDSLFVTINIDMLSINPRRPPGGGGKDMRLLMPHYSESHSTKSSPSIQMSLSDNEEKRKKRKKMKHSQKEITGMNTTHTNERDEDPSVEILSEDSFHNSTTERSNCPSLLNDANASSVM